MKFIRTIAIAVSLLATSILPSVAPAWAEVPPLPNSGTYYIVNLGDGEALTASEAGAGQFVAMREFNKGGMQKWTINRKIDLKTNKPTNRYTISLAGETKGLIFQPHPVADMQSLLSTDNSIMVLAPIDGGFTVKSVAKNGDALRIHTAPSSYTETRFSPTDGSDNFGWKFIPAEE